MKLKVGIGSFWHETSSFSNDYTSLELFKSWIFDEKDVMIEKQRGSTDGFRNSWRICGLCGRAWVGYRAAVGVPWE